jgi:hypothetical protein
MKIERSNIMAEDKKISFRGEITEQDLEKDNLNVNDFYFDRMKYVPELDMVSFLDEWKNA